MAEKADKGPNFEESIERLEEIIEQMESGDLPLEKVIAHYEEGMKLLETCGKKLEDAEKKIKLLTRDKSGKVKSRPFEGETESDGGSGKQSSRSAKDDGDNNLL
jgi:exodeoxyribonuclease VII small subunit